MQFPKYPYIHSLNEFDPLKLVSLYVQGRSSACMTFLLYLNKLQMYVSALFVIFAQTPNIVTLDSILSI